MATKSFKVLYYNTQIDNQQLFLRDELSTINTLLSKNNGNHLPTIEIDSEKFQIRDLFIDGSKKEWRGVFGRLRNDAPNVIDINNTENQLALSPDDLLIEKVHFIYKSRFDILVWQVNPTVGFIGKFENYLNNMLEKKVFMLIVTGTSSLSKVLKGTIKYYEVKVATTKDKISQIPQYSQAAFDLMNNVGGSSIKYKISAGRYQLSDTVKQLIKKLFSDVNTESLKVKLEGDDEPVDLFIDRISKRINVTLNGHYPDTKDIFKELNLAFDQQKPDLKGSFH